MDFSEANHIIGVVLKLAGCNYSTEIDGIIVKKLEASNTLDAGRRTNQTHIAITGPQMDMFPYIRADGYFEVPYEIEDNNLKKYFVGQIPVHLHSGNLAYLGDYSYPDETEIPVHVSIVRSRRNNAADQAQMSMTNLDSPVFVAARKLVHAGSYMIVTKRKNQFLYDMFFIKGADATLNGSSLEDLNNGFFKLPTNTVVQLDDYLVPDYSEPVYHTGILCPFSKARIFYGAPGTGKSYKVEQDRQSLMKSGALGGYERVTFHPNYTYSQFVGTYKPVSDADKKIEYKFVPGPFLRIYTKALQSGKSLNPQLFILIIEEINRAEVAAVFGDAFQLLDRNEDGLSMYPVQASEDIRRYLSDTLGGIPDDYPELILPDNMLIWATMNSADQGVFPMDTAFKRRWDFTYIGINDNDREIEEKFVELCGQKVKWNNVRKAINKYLAGQNINEDKQLGPYFLSKGIVVPKEGNEIDHDKFVYAFKNKVLMYLFEDAARQRRASIFSGCGENANRYSEICNMFDDKGIEIFAPEIQRDIVSMEMTED